MRRTLIVVVASTLLLLLCRTPRAWGRLQRQQKISRDEYLQERQRRSQHYRNRNTDERAIVVVDGLNDTATYCREFGVDVSRTFPNRLADGDTGLRGHGSVEDVDCLFCTDVGAICEVQVQRECLPSVHDNNNNNEKQEICVSRMVAESYYPSDPDAPRREIYVQYDKDETTTGRRSSALNDLELHTTGTTLLASSDVSTRDAVRNWQRCELGWKGKTCSTCGRCTTSDGHVGLYFDCSNIHPEATSDQCFPVDREDSRFFLPSELIAFFGQDFPSIDPPPRGSSLSTKQAVNAQPWHQVCRDYEDDTSSVCTACEPDNMFCVEEPSSDYCVSRPGPPLAEKEDVCFSRSSFIDVAWSSSHATKADTYIPKGEPDDNFDHATIVVDYSGLDLGNTVTYDSCNVSVDGNNCLACQRCVEDGATADMVSMDCSNLVPDAIATCVPNTMDLFGKLYAGGYFKQRHASLNIWRRDALLFAMAMLVPLGLLTVRVLSCFLGFPTRTRRKGDVSSKH